MNRIRLALATLAIGALSQQALAADIPGAGAPLLRAPAAVIASSWAGIYAGGHVGYAWVNNNYRLNDGFIEQFTFDTSGFLGGGQLGAQAQWGHWVLGLEGTYSGADLAQTHTSALIAGKTAAVDVRQIATITGKIGWAASDRWMVYGKGGFAFGRFHTLDINSAGTNFDMSVWENGYTLGLGMDFMWSPNWVVGAEFDYYAFRFNRQLFNTGIRAAITDSDADIFAFMIRLSYLFGTRW